MLVRAFLNWFSVSAVRERADAVRMLSAAYLDDTLGSDSPEEVEAALAVALDDPSPLVRLALAESLAGSDRVPRTIIVSLAQDQGEVAAPVLTESPRLTEADLVDRALFGDAAAQEAIARRNPFPSWRVVAALAETGRPGALLALLARPDRIEPRTLLRLAVRLGAEPAVREMLLKRTDLPLPARHHLVQTVSEQLLQFVARAGYMAQDRAERIIGEARQAATVALAARPGDGADAALEDLVTLLRRDGQLTAGLLLRSLLCGDWRFFETAAAQVSGLSGRKVEATLRSGSDGALAALLRKAGISDRLEPAFIAAIRAIRRAPAPPDGEAPGRIRRDLVRLVMAACAAWNEAGSLDLLAMLRRFEAEAAREDARRLVAAMQARQAPDTIALDVVPQIGARSTPVAAIGAHAVAQALMIDAPPPTPAGRTDFDGWDLRR